MKKRSWLLLLASVMVGAAALGALPMTASTASADDAACGGKENPCPLQKWMRTNMGPALANNDMPGLAKALDHAAGFSPDASWTWAQMAKAGAEAARKGDVAGAKASCKSCHDAYKDKYKTQFRTRPVS
jgi:hypothetical protein